MFNFYNQDYIKSQKNFELENLLHQEAKPSEKCINFLLKYSKAAEIKNGKKIKVLLIKN
tara:strand:- start:335 stop:511 length:177 start_codon:yes stop_codon:yes gene_type:complete